jgi:hypothetical protein
VPASDQEFNVFIGLCIATHSFSVAQIQVTKLCSRILAHSSIIANTISVYHQNLAFARKRKQDIIRL